MNETKHLTSFFTLLSGPATCRLQQQGRAENALIVLLHHVEKFFRHGHALMQTHAKEVYGIDVDGEETSVKALLLAQDDGAALLINEDFTLAVAWRDLAGRLRLLFAEEEWWRMEGTREATIQRLARMVVSETALQLPAEVAATVVGAIVGSPSGVPV